MVVFPLTIQPLAVNRPLSVDAVNRALASDRLVLILQQSSDVEQPDPQHLERVGTIAAIRQMVKTEQGLRLVVEGLSRARAEFFNHDQQSIRALIKVMPETAERSIEVDARVRRIHELVDRALSLASGLSSDLRTLVASIDDPLRLVYLLATLLDMKPVDRQKLLEEDALSVKLDAIATTLSHEISLLELKGRIESQAQQEMTDAQRQYFLRQQMKAIQTELGEGQAPELGSGSTRPISPRRSRRSCGRRWNASNASRRRHPNTRCCGRTSIGCSRFRGRSRPPTDWIRSRPEACSTRTTTTSTRSRSASSSTWRCAS
jgi:ATP-dependent Lon protease